MPSARRAFRSRRRRLGLSWRWGVIAVVAATVVGAGVVGILDYGATLFRAVPVAVGEPAPTFVLESSAGLRVDLRSYAGNKAVLLVFHGGYACASCRAQLGKLRGEIGQIRASGVEILAISDDPIIDAKRVAAELGHEIVILSDRTRWVARRYGMQDPERHFITSGYVIIDRSGRIRERRVDSLFGEHADEIVNSLTERQNG